ncbi:MAG: sulfatase, partial [Planctomycetes bacterium]|nr:sulfatase [Planctomycetota bacterium]
CTPSRAALPTGRLPARTGMCSDRRRVLFPNSKGGLQKSELTIAEGLKSKGYATACFGKWHLGHLPQFLPTSHGFDTYFGIPYSNDMDRVAEAPRGRASFLKPRIEYWKCPLMRDEKIIEQPTDQRTITRRYTEEAVKFIRANKDKPFFVYLPHSMPHVPLFASKQFLGTSRRGLYGDVIEEIDWSVGQVLSALRSEGLDQDTIVFFTSDNGPWLIFNEHGGSAGLLRGGKGSTWEGGMREPTIIWGPGRVRQGVSQQISSTMDIMATIFAQAGIALPKNRVMDTHDLTPVLEGKGPSTRQAVFYYRGYKLMAVRRGSWKMHIMTQSGYGQRQPTKHDPPQLYHLDRDPSEKYNVAKENSKVIAEMVKLIEKHKKEMKAAPSQLEIR